MNGCEVNLADHNQKMDRLARKYKCGNNVSVYCIEYVVNEHLTVKIKALWKYCQTYLSIKLTNQKYPSGNIILEYFYSLF